jgi:hypothetical protein
VSPHQSQSGMLGSSPHAHVRHQGVDVRCDVEQGNAELGWHFQLVILMAHSCLRTNGYLRPPCLGAMSQCWSASRTRQTERRQPHHNDQSRPRGCAAVHRRSTKEPLGRKGVQSATQNLGGAVWRGSSRIHCQGTAPSMAETWVSWLSHQDTLTNFIVFLVVFHLLAVVSFPEGREVRHGGGFPGA